MPLPVIDTAQMRDWEQRTWAAGMDQKNVIQRAGNSFAAAILPTLPPYAHLLVLAGRGHNGDDARAAVSSLCRHHVTLINVNDPALELPSIQAWLNSKAPANSRIIDGLFGIGLNRPLTGSWETLINLINQSGIPVLSVDVPSGLNPDSGEAMGTAIRAAVTVTFGAPKAGLIKHTAAEHVGRLLIAPDIGLIPCPVETSDELWILDSDFHNYPPPRAINSHKGTYGHLGIFAGSLGYHGAAVLAARGAQRAQPGLITLMTPLDVYAPIAAQLTSTMAHPWESESWRKNEYSAVLFGPGLANPNVPSDLKAHVIELWLHATHPVIVDASGLDWLPQSNGPLPGIRVITPHPGEAARMLGAKTIEVQTNRSAALRSLSRKYGGCWAILKGHLTLIGSDTSPISVNSSGNPYLAQGGSGDVLAGLIAGYLAQPAAQSNMPMALQFAVWRHGKAADALMEKRMFFDISDLLEQLKFF